ncbi:hypothetical protein NDU88_002723 [Pleurodeles waltl]|uniref:Uncharacterized protein n=1 Tax=Pleurodeles waltl TaxID=8319 RepID=A0AAV7RCR2_PLEWA|nr:hypothetical protein NDU88_002723 [Pleurodeles waltl]
MKYAQTSGAAVGPAVARSDWVSAPGAGRTIVLLQPLLPGAGAWWRPCWLTCTAPCIPLTTGPTRRLCRTAGAQGS